MRILIGIFFGIIIATIGFTGVATLLDNSIDNLQQTVKEIAK
jgi:uncharacterized iron-regulated membrane protein